MAAVANNPEFAKKAGVPQSVGKEFSTADKGKTFKKGGDMATKMDPKMMAALMSKRAPAAPAGGMGAAGTPMGGMGMKEGGTIHHHLAAHHMKEAAKHMKMAGGGETMGPRGMGSDVEKGSNKNLKHGEHGIQKKGHTKAMEPKMAGSDTGMKRGGKVR